MAPFFLIAFITVPLAEIFILIKLGGMIGVLPTIALVIVTAIIGTTLLRRQGLQALLNAQTAMAQGRVPVDSVVDGLCLLVAGAFLLTPGLITDTVGFLLLVPPLRRSLAHWLFRQAVKRGNIDISVFTGEASGSGPSRQPGLGPSSNSKSGTGPVIEGEFERIDEPEQSKANDKPGATPSDRKSPWRKK